MRIALTIVILIFLALPSVAETVTVGEFEVPYRMKDGRMLVLQRDLAPALPDLEEGDETYDLLDILKRHPYLRGTSRDGVVTRVRYYPPQGPAFSWSPEPQPRTTVVRKKTKPVKASWRNESTFAEGDYRVTEETGGGRITNGSGRIVSSSAEDKRQGKYASQKEFEMNTHRTGRHTRPNVIYINGQYKENHYYVWSEDETRKNKGDQLAKEVSKEVEIHPNLPTGKSGDPSERYYIPVEELEQQSPSRVRL